MQKHILFFAIFMSALNTISAQSIREMPLYDGPIPNAKPAENLEKTTINEWKIEFTTETSVPTLTVYKPRKPNGKAIIVCPGGGYMGTAGDHEGRQVAKALAKWGITAFVLKYRIPDDRYCVDKNLAPLQDAQQAIRTVRKNAVLWKINPHKIGIMGFSAGGHLAATATTHFDQLADPTCTDTTSVRPDFSMLIYAVISFQDSLTHEFSRMRLLGEHPSVEQKRRYSNEMQVNKSTPPTFLVHAADDDAVKVQNSLEFYMACVKNGVPAEMHLYPKGGHGFGMHNKTTQDKWMERLRNWLD